MKNKKTAFMTFFPIKPDTMGSSAVINARYNSWPYEKKIFQLSHLNSFKDKNIQTIFIKKESPYYKIIKLPKIIIAAYKYLNNGKENILVIEGASWIFYSFCALLFFKIFLPSTKIIYISHSVEFEIRKKYSNFLISFLTFIFEYLVFHLSNISTTVSKVEREKIYNLYKKKTTIYPNGVSINNKINKKILKFNYIIFCGSYSYKPNKIAIDFLNENLMPKLIKEIPNIKLVITGGGYKKKFPWLLNKKIVSKEKLYNFIHFADCMCVPLEFGSGTRIKIIEALILGSIVLSTRKGIEGINLLKKNPPFVSDTNKFINTLIYILKNNRKLKQKAIKKKYYYDNLYSMKFITKKFLKKSLKNFI